MKAIYYGDTNIGNIRPKNEDAFVLKEVWGGTHLIAVCVDGVGGNGGGDVAANLACKSNRLFGEFDGCCEICKQHNMFGTLHPIP